MVEIFIVQQQFVRKETVVFQIDGFASEQWQIKCKQIWNRGKSKIEICDKMPSNIEQRGLGVQIHW